jgi:hypothetical protein
MATNMREWIDAQLRAGFPALAGSAISGTLAVRQELLNELLAAWLAENAARGANPARDFSASMRLLKSASIRAEPGTVLVDFQITIGPERNAPDRDAQGASAAPADAGHQPGG